MVNAAKANSSQLILLIALGSDFIAPKTPELSDLASVVASLVISDSVISSALFIVSLKSSKTKMPSPASSFKILSNKTSSA